MQEAGVHTGVPAHQFATPGKGSFRYENQCLRLATRGRLGANQNSRKVPAGVEACGQEVKQEEVGRV